MKEDEVKGMLAAISEEVRIMRNELMSIRRIVAGDKDLISKNKAISLFKRKWVNEMIKLGKVSVHKESDAPNGKCFMSLTELTALRDSMSICTQKAKKTYNV